MPLDSPSPQVISEISNISSIDTLLKTLETDETKQKSLKDYIADKYGLENATEILNITQTELAELQVEYKKGVDIKNILGDFVYEEYIETQIEVNDSLDNISVDDMFVGMESEGSVKLKEELQSELDTQLKGFDFLGSKEKTLIMLSLLSQSTGLLTKIGGLIQPKSQTDNTTTDTTSKLNEAATRFSDDIKKYSSIGTQLQTYFTKQGDTLSQENKQKIVQSIDWYNPKSGVTDFLADLKIAQISALDNKDDNLGDIKAEILAIREKMESSELLTNGKEIFGEKMLQLAQSGTGSILLKKLLGFPIIGKFLAMIMGLDSTNPIESLEKESSKYKVYNNLIGLGIQTKEETVDGKKVKTSVKGKGIFENIDFGEQNYQENKKYIGEIQKITGITDVKKLSEFWQTVFSETGFDTEEGNIKFSGLQYANNFDKGVMNKGVLSKILQKGLDNYTKNQKKSTINYLEKAIVKDDASKIGRLSAEYTV